MSQIFNVGDRVKIQLDANRWGIGGWFKGSVVRIDPYSQHRNFYWVELDEPLAGGTRLISIFNPKNIQRD
jgi:hypothetical protein